MMIFKMQNYQKACNGRSKKQTQLSLILLKFFRLKPILSIKCSEIVIDDKLAYCSYYKRYDLNFIITGPIVLSTVRNCKLLKDESH